MNDNELDILKILNELEKSINKVEEAKSIDKDSDIYSLLINKTETKVRKKAVSQKELFMTFKESVQPTVNETILEFDAKIKEQIEQSNDHDNLKYSMSFNFITDLKFLVKSYLDQLNFAYYMRYQKNLFIVSKNPEQFLIPVSMVFAINNFLAFYSFKSLPTIQSTILVAFEELKAKGYCTDNEDDPNSPHLVIGIKQHDFSFELDCKNNFLEINAPVKLKQEIYFKIVSSFANEIINNLRFEFTAVNTNTDQEYLDIYPSFLENKMIFLKHLTEQFFQRS